MSEHLGFRIAIFTMFFIGQAVHAWLRAANTINSKLNGINSYQQYAQVNGAQIASRFFVAYCIFAAWAWHGPEMLAALIRYVPSLQTITGSGPADRIIPVNGATAGVFGYLADSLIDTAVGLLSKRWPSLQKDIPPVADPPAKAA